MSTDIQRKRIFAHSVYVNFDNSLSFCPECGTPTSATPAKCPKCGQEVEKGVKFCPSYGQDLSKPSTLVKPEPDPDKPYANILLNYDGVKMGWGLRLRVEVDGMRFYEESLTESFSLDIEIPSKRSSVTVTTVPTGGLQRESSTTIFHQWEQGGQYQIDLSYSSIGNKITYCLSQIKDGYLHEIENTVNKNGGSKSWLAILAICVVCVFGWFIYSDDNPINGEYSWSNKVETNWGNFVSCSYRQIHRL